LTELGSDTHHQPLGTAHLVICGRQNLASEATVLHESVGSAGNGVDNGVGDGVDDDLPWPMAASNMR
jgi:hypothetical protein